jgi:hypothetical protein
MRSLRGAALALAGTLAAVYLIAAATTAPVQPAAAAGEAAVGLVELLWLLVAWRAASPRVLSAGVALQGLLVGAWVLTRTIGVPGLGRLPAGEFDVLCVIDAAVTGAIALALRGGRSILRVRMALCQLAAVLAGATAYMGMVSMMAMASPRTIAFGAWLRGPRGPHFFCHLL